MWDMSRAVGRGMLVVGLMMQTTPVAWAQLAEIDPALHAAVEALVAADPEVAGDAELAQLCRSVAESTVTDIRERAAVSNEVVAMQREGIDIASIIPTEVREAAREQFAKVQGEMQKELEALKSVDPEKAKEMELTMREGEKCMLAFESGERYTPSTEMVAHAEGMFKDWESDMISQGAPPEFVERAKMEFAAWSGGEHMGFGGPGTEFAGPMGGGGMHEMPTLEQMQQMGMTPEQIQMAQTGNWEGSNYGINPATGGYEPGMGGMTGGMTDWGAHGGAVVGYTDFSAGFGNPESWSNTNWTAGTEASYGINPATGGHEPGFGGGPGYTGDTAVATGTATSWEGHAWEGTMTDAIVKDSAPTDTKQGTEDHKAETMTEKLLGPHDHDGVTYYHYDTNGDTVMDHEHTMPH